MRFSNECQKLFGLHSFRFTTLFDWLSNLALDMIFPRRVSVNNLINAVLLVIITYLIDYISILSTADLSSFIQGICIDFVSEQGSNFII